MTTNWFAQWIRLFQPEDSTRLPGGVSFAATPCRPVNRRISFSGKALVWILISVLSGLAIGQLG